MRSMWKFCHTFTTKKSQKQVYSITIIRNCEQRNFLPPLASFSISLLSIITNTYCGCCLPFLLRLYSSYVIHKNAFYILNIFERVRIHAYTFGRSKNSFSNKIMMEFVWIFFALPKSPQEDITACYFHNFHIKML